MKAIKNIILSIVTVVVLLFQLMSPALVHADGETPPSPTDIPVETTTPSLTDVAPTESSTPALPADTPSATATESPTFSGTDPASPTVDPVEINTSIETPTSVPTDPPTEVVPAESSTPDLSSSMPPSTETDSPTLAPTDPASPTLDPVETDISAETSTLVPTESATVIVITESPTQDASLSTPAPIDSPTLDASLSTPLPGATDSASLTPSAPASQTGLPTESNTPTEKPPRERPSTTPEPTRSTPDPTETTAPTEAVAAEQPTLLESVQTISNDTSVVVLDANGQPEPLVTQDAADIIANSDPVWCPIGQAPTPGTNGCSASFTTLAGLVFAIGATTNQDGTVWITSGNVGDMTPITIDGTTTTWSNYSLTLQGGWSGASGDTTIGSNSIFSVPITISNWNNNVTVNNITVDNASGTGLTIDTTENVTIANSAFSGNGGDGAYIAHCDPQGCITSADITISNSTFSGNTGNGASISFGADVTISDSTFSGNSGDGASISFGTGNVTISNSTFNGNSRNGASIGFVADTTISNGTFSGNGGDGASIGFVADTTISNSTFIGNSGDGAYISADSVTISNSAFSGNGGDGLVIPSYDITIDNSTFSGNGGNGATIYYENVTISNSTFSNNNNVGLSLNGGSSGSTPGVATLICNHYQNNGQDENFTTVIALVRISCNENPKPLPQFVIIVPAGQDTVEFSLDCYPHNSFLVAWSNGDRFLISCVAGGIARITRVDNTALTPDLPTGYEYAAAYNVEIFQHGVSLPVVPAGGFIRASFASRHENPQYGIMVWDEKINNWTLLQEYQKDPSGGPVVFPLDRSNPQDERKILKGTRFITTEDPDREEVTTNFTGTFVLVQQ